MIDRNLNYGRHHIESFVYKSLPFDSVLDIGAGKGTDLFLARKVNPQAKLHALEAYEPNVQILSANEVSVFSADIEREKYPFDNGEIDVVIANQVLEHTKELFWIFHEVSRILPLGGKLIIGVPNLAALHNRILLAMGRQPSSIKTHSAHVRGFTKRDLLKFVGLCFPDGYELVGFGGSNFYPFPPVMAKPLAKMLPNMAWGIFLLLEKKRPYNREFLEFPIKERLETNFYLGPS